MEEIPDIPGVDPKLLRDPLFQQLMAEGLAIRDRFSAEPIHAQTEETVFREFCEGLG